MTQKEFDRLPQGTTLYFVNVDIQGLEAEIDHIKKGEWAKEQALCGMFSTTKQGAITTALENYAKQVSYYTGALSSVTELMKKYI